MVPESCHWRSCFSRSFHFKRVRLVLFQLFIPFSNIILLIISPFLTLTAVVPASDYLIITELWENPIQSINQFIKIWINACGLLQISCIYTCIWTWYMIHVLYHRPKAGQPTWSLFAGCNFLPKKGLYWTLSIKTQVQTHIPETQLPGYCRGNVKGSPSSLTWINMLK
jgi:hypothetical protein